MLRKVISIKNVGRFLSFDAVGDTALKRYTLVFAENGRGKTTLCAILRSLQSGDPSYVLGRSTLGTTGPPQVKILLDRNTATFSYGTWDATGRNIAIFDSTFVSENVYSGDAVDLEHRRNLYRVMVGKEGVALARQIEELDAATREKSGDIREKRATVQRFVPEGLSVDEFLQLEQDPAIDQKISDVERELEAVRQADQIRSRAALSELLLPSFPAGFAAGLERTLEGVSEDAERRLTAQIETHAMHERGEPWLSEGLSYVRNNSCPFCAQSLDGVALIASYQACFGDAYNALRAEIQALRDTVDVAFGDREIARIERTLDQNTGAAEFWSRYCAITAPVLRAAHTLGDTLRGLRQTALALLDRKAAAVLDRVPADGAFTAAHGAFVAAQDNAAAYNQAVHVANTAVAGEKALTAAADIRVVESALTRLRATKKRQEVDVRAACQAYQAAIAAKGTLENEKGIVKQQLDSHTRDVIGRYENSINRFLDDFEAGFRITGTGHGYPGGVASCTFQILINETAVELGDSYTQVDRPSFRNTLSSGDRSTLALAFFLAQLEQDPEKAAKVVVFDDPFNSQDGFRKDWTVRKIKECGESCSQVIVLSHDQMFLKRIWDRLNACSADRKCLKLARIGLRNTTISSWDIAEATQSRFVADRNALTDYYSASEGRPADVVGKIRPVLETHCRNVCPGQFDGEALGTIICNVRSAGSVHSLFPLLPDLEALNEYTCRYHHGDDPGAAAEPPDDAELQGFVKKTLTITGGC